MSSVAGGVTECLNCGSLLAGPFCPQCGQKAAAADPTFHDFLHEATHELLHVDGTMARSIRLLFTRPGFLTTEHNAGRRVSYTPPLRLYLTFSLIFFVLAVYAPLDWSVRMDASRGRVLHTGGLDVSGDLLKGRSDEEVARLIRDFEHEWTPRAMFVMVPVWALIMLWADRRHRRHFPQHLYFALHTHAAWFGLLSVEEVALYARQPAVAQYAPMAAVAGIVVYTAIAIRSVYGVTWMRAAARTVLTLFTYVATLVLVTIGTFMAVYRYSHP
ncbi:MAG TPA: DUF3667 domain-containing protein [Vicinamibacterales bacterium]|nr:DUF3667 domain-containing protein [Vicinamibacterales bacterium]